MSYKNVIVLQFKASKTLHSPLLFFFLSSHLPTPPALSGMLVPFSLCLAGLLVSGAFSPCLIPSQLFQDYMTSISIHKHRHTEMAQKRRTTARMRVCQSLLLPEEKCDCSEQVQRDHMIWDEQGVSQTQWTLHKGLLMESPRHNT